MCSISVSLQEHISKDHSNIYPIATGKVDVPQCHAIAIEENGGATVKTCNLEGDRVGSSALLHAYSNAILLEALVPYVSILPPGWTSSKSNANKHEGVRVRLSTPHAQILVQLRPGDQFMITSRRFSLTISGVNIHPTPSGSEHSTVVCLEVDPVDHIERSLAAQASTLHGDMSALARQDEIGREAQSESVGIDQTNQAQNSLASENSILRRESLDNTEILPPLAQGNSEAPPSASDLTLSEVLFPPVVPSDHRQSENDTKARSVVGHNEAHLLPKALEQQQSVNDQSPSAHRNSEQVQPKVHQVDTHHPEGPSSSSPRTSEPPVHESSDTLIVSKSTLRDSSPEKSKRVSDVLPQLTDEDTQTSTTARIDDLFQRAGLDSDSTNNVEGGLIHPSPRGTAVFTRIEIGTRAAVGPKPSSIVPTIEDEDTDIDDELKGTVPDTTPVHGRPKNNHPPKTTKPIKRNVEALQEDVHTNLKTPAKRRKIHDSESSMESTIQVRPYSSRRKAASSQSSSKENRGLSAMSPETGSATRSQRTAEEQALNGTLYNGPPPCILFSNSKVDEKPQLIKFLNHRGGRKVTAVDDCTMLCVGPGELKKTSKLLLAVASGKDIVRDKWLVDSAKQGRLLDPTPYWAEDPGREDEWGTKLEAAVARGKACVKPFTGRTVHFTPTLKRELGSGFTELKEVALLAGAAAVYAKLPPKGADPDADTLVLASQHGNDASIVRQSGWNCYNKDIISLGVLHGRLDTISGKFVIKPSGSQETKGGKRKKK